MFQHKLVLKSLEAEKAEAKKELLLEVPEGESLVGPFKVKRWHVDGRRSFQFKAYDAAGISDPTVEQFTAQSEGHDRVDVEQVYEADVEPPNILDHPDEDIPF
jgi:hypothetical protein